MLLNNSLKSFLFEDARWKWFLVIFISEMNPLAISLFNTFNTFSFNTSYHCPANPHRKSLHNERTICPDAITMLNALLNREAPAEPVDVGILRNDLMAKIFLGRRK